MHQLYRTKCYAGIVHGPVPDIEPRQQGRLTVDRPRA
jgi:hypothetical protein